LLVVPLKKWQLLKYYLFLFFVAISKNLGRIEGIIASLLEESKGLISQPNRQVCNKICAFYLTNQ